MMIHFKESWTPLLQVSVIILGLLFLLWVLVQLDLAGDFLGYWSASVVTISGQNAQDESLLYAVQQATGRGFPFTMRVWNPPWTMVVLAPLALMPFALARAIWFILCMALFALAGYWLGRTYLPEGNVRALAPFLPFLTLPTYTSLAQGQINILVLVGLAGALYFIERRALLAGALLTLATVKPQIAVGAGLMLALWALKERRWGLFAGGALVLMLLLATLTMLRPQWWSDYQAVLATPLTQWRSPTLATWVREQWPTLPTDALALLLAISAWLAAATWALRTGRWRAAIAHATVITMLFTVFSWSYDQIILLLPAYYLLGRVHARPGLFRFTAAALLLISVVLLLQRINSRDDFDFFWVPSAFTLIYLLALRTRWPGRVTPTPPTP
jgi:hypothetical protein